MGGLTMVRVMSGGQRANGIGVLTVEVGYKDGKYYLPNDEVL